jgi:hypothetical protein
MAWQCMNCSTASEPAAAVEVLQTLVLVQRLLSDKRMDQASGMNTS